MADGDGAYGRREIATIRGRAGDRACIAVETIEGDQIITSTRDEGDPLELTPASAAEVIRALATAITITLGKS